MGKQWLKIKAKKQQNRFMRQNKNEVRDSG